MAFVEADPDTLRITGEGFTLTQEPLRGGPSPLPPPESFPERYLPGISVQFGAPLAWGAGPGGVHLQLSQEQARSLLHALQEIEGRKREVIDRYYAAHLERLEGIYRLNPGFRATLLQDHPLLADRILQREKAKEGGDVPG